MRKTVRGGCELNDFIKGLLLCLTLPAVTDLERQMLKRTTEYSEFVNRANILGDKILLCQLRHGVRPFTINSYQ